MMLRLVPSHLRSFRHEEKVLVEEHYSWQKCTCKSSHGTGLKYKLF